MKYLITYVFVLFGLFSGYKVIAQIPTNSDCLGAIPVCQEIYNESNSPNGEGNYTFDLMGYNNNCLPYESNSVWYTFTVNQTGDFGFLLSPNNASDDYDWALFNLTGIDCNDILTEAAGLVSCNNSGGGSCNGPTGATGASPYSSIGAGCGGINTPLNDLISVQQGETYVLYINNFTASPFGYTLDFGISNVGIFDNENPQILSSSLDGICSPDQIILTFTENIQCNTVFNYNFELSGPGGPFSTSVNSLNCDYGFSYDDVFIINIDPPLIDGTYDLDLNFNSSNELLDLCDNQAVSTTQTFTTTFCENTVIIECDDGNDLTLNDVAVVEYCDNQIICQPCEGVLPCENSIDSLYYLCEGDSILIANGMYVNTEGIFTSIFTNQAGCDSTVNFITSFYEQLQIESADTFYAFIAEYLKLEIEDNALIPSYNWQPSFNLSCFDCKEPVIYSEHPGIFNYSLSVTDEESSCNTSKSIVVHFIEKGGIYIPNVFSPNSDGINDVIDIKFNGILQEYEFSVFNRWGEMVFFSDNELNQWTGRRNGKVLQGGVYVYIIKAKFLNDEVLFKKGNITLIR